MIHSSKYSLVYYPFFLSSYHMTAISYSLKHMVLIVKFTDVHLPENFIYSGI